jgi:Arc/MetJ-type ribon-helix-helix transcriptional regulator
MAKILTFEVPENEYNDFSSFLNNAVEEMRQSREAIAKDQSEIIKLRKESTKIKENTDKIKNETRKILDEMSAKWLKAA